MTNTEFNEKYKEYLETDFYGLSFNNEKITKYLNDVFEDLIKIPGFRYSQIKLKFNSCRFYSTLGSALSEAIENEINNFLEVKDPFTKIN